jgi:hypothetical protein
MGDTIRIRYDGPAGQLNREVAAALHEAGDEDAKELLEPGREYALPVELAARVARSSAHFVALDPLPEVPGPKVPADMTVTELDAAYGELAGYPAKGVKAEKVAFAEGVHVNSDPTGAAGGAE